MTEAIEHLKKMLEPDTAGGVAEADQPPGSAEGEPEPVAADTGVAEAEATEEESTPDSTPTLPDDLTSDERVRKWQSAYDKKLAAERARIAELEAKLAERTPSPEPEKAKELESSRNERLEEWRKLQDKLKEASGAERDALAVQEWQTRRAIYDLDVQRYALQYGADPDDELFKTAFDSGEVQSPRDVERLALLQVWKRGLGGLDKRQAELDAREAEIAKREKEIDNRLKEERAKLRRELGLNDVPGAGEARKPSEFDSVLADYQRNLDSDAPSAVKRARAMRMKLEHPEVFSNR